MDNSCWKDIRKFYDVIVLYNTALFAINDALLESLKKCFFFKSQF